MLDPPVDSRRDHVLGPPNAEMTLVEYGSYACTRSHAVHEVVEGLRRRFGERLRYVFRHLPAGGNQVALRAAELAEYAAQTSGQFWEVHEALMQQGPALAQADLERIARDFGLPATADRERALASANQRMQEDIAGAARSGARTAPTFFINNRRYTGTWDESSMADALLAPLGYRIQAAAFQFVRWGPASGLLLLLASVVAVVLSNSPLGATFLAWWNTPMGFAWGSHSFVHSLLHWTNHGLLTIFFFVVGIEIKQEFTVGHLSSLRSGVLPVIAALGGIVVPAAIYALIAPPALRHGWGIPIGTDTAFAVALIVLLGKRVPIELRVFLTAAVIIDDIVAIAVIAIFYSGQIHADWLIASGVVTLLLIVLNRTGVQRTLPYLIGGIVLWLLLHEAGLHATLAGVVLAALLPTRPPVKLHVLLSQAAAVIHLENSQVRTAMRAGPSEPTLRALDAIHSRIEPPADKLLRYVEPWSSYVVLPIFALANAGVVWSFGAFAQHGRLIWAVALGLVLGKPLGIVLGAWLAVRGGIATKPDAYSWRQLCGAAAIGGIGFTMSLFITDLAFPDQAVKAAAKIAIFLASLAAGALGASLLWRARKAPDDEVEVAREPES